MSGALLVWRRGYFIVFPGNMYLGAIVSYKYVKVNEFFRKGRYVVGITVLLRV
jgi:hypothetical protein